MARRRVHLKPRNADAEAICPAQLRASAGSDVSFAAYYGPDFRCGLIPPSVEDRNHRHIRCVALHQLRRTTIGSCELERGCALISNVLRLTMSTRPHVLLS